MMCYPLYWVFITLLYDIVFIYQIILLTIEFCKLTDGIISSSKW